MCLGEVPWVVFPFMPNLIELWLNQNNFTGKIHHDSLRQMTSLKYLGLSHNQFRGSIPPDIKHLTRLQILSLGSNNFEGIAIISYLM